MELEAAISKCLDRIPIYVLSQQLVALGLLHTVSISKSRILLLTIPHPDHMEKLKHRVKLCHILVGKESWCVLFLIAVACADVVTIRNHLFIVLQYCGSRIR